MRIIIVWLSAILFSALTLSAEKMEPKPAWAWREDERLAERLAPDAIARRVHEYARSQNMAASESMQARGVRQSFVVDGGANPELFMPWELMDSLLGGAERTSDDGVNHFKAGLHRDIIAFGWKPEEFWAEIDRIGSEYQRTKREASRHPRFQSRLNDAASRPNDVEGEDLQQQLCRVRAEALHDARLEFGKSRFDEFLYAVVARDLVLISDAPLSSDELHRIEQGCP
ncbi:MAG TPA: hypothetical protein VF215_05690 [Thermoanaerobaculia bacterium]